MKKSLAFLLLCFQFILASCGSEDIDDSNLSGSIGSEFNAPWKNSSTAIIIDAYGKNSIDWNKMATDKRVVAVIHKASEGLTKDSQYEARKAEAKRRGYLWGSYHLGRPGDPIQQADYYLSVTKPAADELIALDLEAVDSNFMTIDQARKFILRIKEKTGRFPVFYANHSTTTTISRSVGVDGVFSNSPLWYARFKSEVTDFPRGTWKSYAIWQFSAEVNCSSNGSCLYNVPGTRFDMDVNVYNGSVSQLRSVWPFTKTSGSTTITNPPITPDNNEILLKLNDGMPSGRLEKRNEVLAMQKYLQILGYNVVADGKYGPGTKSAVASFLRDNSRNGDGSVVTRGILNLMRRLATQ